MEKEKQIEWTGPALLASLVENAAASGVDLSPYINPIASLRSERKIKPGRAAKLLGISRQRLHKVEHAQRELPCMERLLEKAQRVWRAESEEVK